MSLYIPNIRVAPLDVGKRSTAKIKGKCSIVDALAHMRRGKRAKFGDSTYWLEDKQLICKRYTGDTFASKMMKVDRILIDGWELL